MSLRERTRPGLGIIEPCPPSPGKAPPSGPGWLDSRINHEAQIALSLFVSLAPKVPMLSTLVSIYSRPILLLVGSNVFMTLAWYGHLRFKQVPLFGVIVASWAIAFIEYCMAVPANRLGSAVYTTAQLKTMQEVITLLVFAGFSILYLKEPMTWNYVIGFVLIASGAYFVFRGPFSAALF